MSTPIAPNFSGLLNKLSIDELTQVVAAATPALSSAATGDGSTTSLMGAWLQLQGAFIGNVSVFQKIGVNDLAAALLTEMNTVLTAAQTKARTQNAANAAASLATGS